jgi:hypothetical protein
MTRLNGQFRFRFLISSSGGWWRRPVVRHQRPSDTMSMRFRPSVPGTVSSSNHGEAFIGILLVVIRDEVLDATRYSRFKSLHDAIGINLRPRWASRTAIERDGSVSAIPRPSSSGSRRRRSSLKAMLRSQSWRKCSALQLACICFERLGRDAPGRPQRCF